MQQQQAASIQNSYQFFSSMPRQQRDKYYKTVHATKQNESPRKKVFAKEYPSSGSFSYQGHKIHYYKLEQTNKPKAILIHFHGYLGHGGTSGYYADVIAKNNPGVNIYAFDQLNFGQSEGPCRGLAPPPVECGAQGDAFIDHLLQQFETKPKIFLSGSSYGGAIIFKMAIAKKERYNGIILLSGALREDKTAKMFIKKIGRFLGWIAPTCQIAFKPSSNDMSKYNCDQQLRNDPYYENTLVPGSVRNILDAMDEISKQYRALETSFLTIQGGMDKTVDLFAPIDLMAESPCKDKQAVYYRNMWHGVFYEQETEDFALRVAAWIGKRI